MALLYCASAVWEQCFPFLFAFCSLYLEMLTGQQRQSFSGHWLDQILLLANAVKQFAERREEEGGGVRGTNRINYIVITREWKQRECAKLILPHLKWNSSLQTIEYIWSIYMKYIKNHNQPAWRVYSQWWRSAAKPSRTEYKSLPQFCVCMR